jgi:hypothetical protein
MSSVGVGRPCLHVTSNIYHQPIMKGQQLLFNFLQGHMWPWEKWAGGVGRVRYDPDGVKQNLYINIMYINSEIATDGGSRNNTWTLFISGSPVLRLLPLQHPALDACALSHGPLHCALTLDAWPRTAYLTRQLIQFLNINCLNVCEQCLCESYWLEDK